MRQALGIEPSPTKPAARPAPSSRERLLLEDMEEIPGGTFWMGSSRFYREEAPEREATVAPFWIDRHLVTNAQFARFVDQSGYLTVAERELNPSDYPGALEHLLVSGSVVFRRPSPGADLSNHFSWWRYVPGASWKHPYGPDTSVSGMDDHPVVHIAFEDAAAYARWVGKELPTEAEWERAARGGLDRKDYAWGDELSPAGKVMANVWQGEFPYQNLVEDGYETTSPVGAFPPNHYGLYDMIGNVWEWTTDWWQDRRAIKGSCCASHSPDAIPESSYDPQLPAVRIPRKVLKGGSFLCASNYCVRYRPAARIPQQVDTGTCHQGFRCVVRVSDPGPMPGTR